MSDIPQPEVGFHQPMPNPTPGMLDGDPLFDAIWQTIKSWDVNVPESYGGYCGANGSHVTLIYNAVAALRSPPVAGEAETVTAAWTAIVAERQRQVSVEGWTAEHDDQHTDRSLLRAAVHYLWYGTEFFGSRSPLSAWPWALEWWKPKDARSNQIKAGALCLAEHDRCVRAGLSTGPADAKLGMVLDMMTGGVAHRETVERGLEAIREMQAQEGR